MGLKIQLFSPPYGVVIDNIKLVTHQSGQNKDKTDAILRNTHANTIQTGREL